MPTIYVSRNGNSAQLHLRDSEGNDPGNDNLTTIVAPDDTVQWVYPDPNPDPGTNPISSISRIIRNTKPGNPNSVDLLTGTPAPVDGVWTGTVISTNPTQPGQSFSYEAYTIYYYIPGDSNEHNDDPKLQMNA